MALQYLAVLAGEGRPHRFASRIKANLKANQRPRPLTPETPAARKQQSNYFPQGAAPKKPKFVPRKAPPIVRPGTVSTMGGAHAIQDALLRRR